MSRTVVPRPFSLSMSIEPPWAETVASTIDRPRPLPPRCRERARSARKKRSPHRRHDRGRHDVDTTNDDRRNDKVQDALEIGQYPTTTFVLTEPIEFGDVAAGATIDVQATGELTIHGVTQTVPMPLQAQLVDDTIVVVGSLDIVFADYGVEIPTAPIVASADDHGPIELQLFFTRS